MSTDPVFTVAVGDIHGHLEALDRVIAGVELYSDGRSFRIVFLGDYVDRGPDSKGVVTRVMERVANGDIALKGNHEDMLVAALSDRDGDVRFWIDNGGYPTLLSWGIDPIDARLIPKEHTDWMRQLPLFHDDGQRFFCHAGVDHTIPLAGQTSKKLMWNRDPIPPWADLPRLIVHGHNPIGPRPVISCNSVNLDTGCGLGGPLSAAVFDPVRKTPVALVVDGEVTELSTAFP